MVYVSQCARQIGERLRTAGLRWMFQRLGAGILKGVKLDASDSLPLGLQVMPPGFYSAKQQIRIGNHGDIHILREVVFINEGPDAYGLWWNDQIPTSYAMPQGRTDRDDFKTLYGLSRETVQSISALSCGFHSFTN